MRLGKIGSLESLRSLESLGRVISSFIRKAQALPKFTILPNFSIFSLRVAPANIIQRTNPQFVVRRVADVALT